VGDISKHFWVEHSAFKLLLVRQFPRLAFRFRWHNAPRICMQKAKEFKEASLHPLSIFILWTYLKRNTRKTALLNIVGKYLHQHDYFPLNDTLHTVEARTRVLCENTCLLPELRVSSLKSTQRVADSEVWRWNSSAFRSFSFRPAADCKQRLRQH